MEKLKIIDYSKEGQGIAKRDNEIYFIENALKDEVVDINIDYKKQNINYAHVIKYHSISNKRENKICQHYNECGGCHLMHMNYDEQIKLKNKAIETLLKKTNNDYIDIEVKKSKKKLEYRNKITFTFFKDEEIYLGFNKKKTHEGVNISYCHLISKRMNDIKEEALSILKEKDFSVYDKKSKKGILKNIIIKENSFGENMLILNVNTNKIEYFYCLEELKISSIIINGNNVKKEIGLNYLKEECGEINYKISPNAFFQVNKEQMINVYDDVKNLVKPDSNILDAYCGSGTIGIYINDKVKSIKGIEINKESIKDAKENANINSVLNTKYYCGDINKKIKDVYKNDEFDTLIIDPPRKGIDKNFLNIIKDIKPKKIIYISCNISTLIRDYNFLKEIYDLKLSKAYDMFPQTYHVETLMYLEKR